MGKAGALEYSILLSEAIIEIDETFAYFFQNFTMLININNTMFITFTKQPISKDSRGLSVELKQ